VSPQDHPDHDAAAAKPLGIWTVLALRNGDDAATLAPLRTAQLTTARRLAPLFLASQLVGAALMSVAIGRLTPLWLAIGWGIAVALFAALIGLNRWRPVKDAASRRAIARWWDGAALGALWAAPPLAATMQPSPTVALAVALVLVPAMAATAMASATLPLAALAFTATASAGLAVLAGAVAGGVAAGAALLFVALLGAAVIGRSRAVMAARARDIALAERDATVSLLLRDSEAMTADWLWEIDEQKRVCRASPRFAYAAGLDPITIDQMPILQVVAGKAWQTGNFSAGLRELADKLKQHENFHDLVLSVDIKGEQRWWQVSGTPKMDEAGNFAGYRGVGSDVTEKHLAIEKIHRLARYDTLTGLPNRVLMIETLTEALADAQQWGGRCAFIVIDLDRFKAVNDTLGHMMGDRLLGRVADQLKRLTGPGELIGRLGGDEFGLVVRDARNAARVEALAQSVVDIVARPYEIDEHVIHVSASLGIAIGPRDGRSAETLIRSADLALYRSKDAGGSTARYYEPQLHTQAEERRVLEIALRKALQNGELGIAYQPVVEAGTGQLVCFEALARWHSPDFGEVPPSKFIPLAEQARLIEPIGEWILRSACAEAAQWPEPVRVAVNVSAEQLNNPNFVAIVASALANSGLDPTRLSLEVTESIFMREGNAVTAVLDQILALGVKLSLDDFGTGFSSLGYLSRTRFESIKIDRSFVKAAARGTVESIAIIRAVIALAESLNMATIAEGVETDDDLRFVQTAGCSDVQGFLFGRPMPADEARTIINRERARTASASAAPADPTAPPLPPQQRTRNPATRAA